MTSIPGPAETPSFFVKALRYGPGEHLPPHSHALDRLTVIRRGRISECVAGTDVFSSAMFGYWKPGPLIHSTTAGPSGASVLLIERKPEPEGGGRLTAVRSPSAAPAAIRAAELLWTCLCLGKASDRTVFEDLACEVWTAIGEPENPRRAPIPSWIPRVRDRLEEEMLQPTPIGMIAEEEGLAPSYLTRAFRRWFGMGPAEYRVELRLRLATRLLHEPARTITSVALAAGFSDHPHFARRFQRRFGMTPSGYRREWSKG